MHEDATAVCLRVTVPETVRLQRNLAYALSGPSCARPCPLEEMCIFHDTFRTSRYSCSSGCPFALSNRTCCRRLSVQAWPLTFGNGTS